MTSDQHAATAGAATDAAYARVSELASALSPADLHRATPCPGWQVHDLLSHLASNTEAIGQGYSGGKPQWGQPPSGDPVAVIAQASQANSALRAGRPEAATAEIMPGVLMVDMNLIEVVGHAWDLATTLGVPVGLSDETVDAALAAYERLPLDQMRGSSFGEKVVVGEGAPKVERLMGLLGRS